MKKLKTYATYDAALQAERDRERQWRATRQGAFESAFVSFEEAKEAFIPLAAVSAPVRRAAVLDPAKARRAYMKAYIRVRRKAPHCLEVFNLIVKNGPDRQKSICEMITKLKAKKRVLTGATPLNTNHKSGSISSTARSSKSS